MAKRDSKGKFLKGQSGNPGGLTKGTKHKATMIKESFFDAFYQIGGVKGLVAWVKKNDANRQAFYNIMPRFLPKEMEVEADLSDCGNCPYPKHTIIFSDFKNKSKEELAQIAKNNEDVTKQFKGLNKRTEFSNTPKDKTHKGLESSSKQVENRDYKGTEAIPSQVKRGWSAI